MFRFGLLKTVANIFGFALVVVALFYWNSATPNVTGAPPYGEPESEAPELDQFDEYRNWVRPEGPVRVGLQVGHWNSQDLPDELSRLRNNTGSSGGGKWEWEVNLMIAELTAKLLEEKGVVVDILPATVPPDYIADAFVAIHADGSDSSGTSGYKIAFPWRDWSKNANVLADSIDSVYESTIPLRKDPNITRNMRGYYAFAWWRYEHSIHPMTPGVIVETGFLTSPHDRQIIVLKPELVANALAEGILKYLNNKGLF